MLQRFLKAVGLLFLYMGLLAIGLLVWLHYDPEPSESSFLVVFVAMLATFPFAMDWMGKLAFYWKSPMTTQKSLEEVKTMILRIDHPDIPVQVTEKNGVLRITWKYLDARWYEIMSKQGITESYTLRVALNEKKHLATLTDIKKSISWGKGLDFLRFGFFGFRGVSLDVEIGKAWGITECFRPGVIYNYRFTSSEIRNPVLNALLEAGWDVRYGIF